MKRTYKYRIYPNKTQKAKLEATLDTCRFLYNSALRERIEAYKKGVSVNYFDQSRELSDCKLEISELDDVYGQVLQDVLRRLGRAYQNFFKRTRSKQIPGFPRFKGSSRYNSFTYPQASRVNVHERTIYLPKIGSVRLKKHRDFDGVLKTCTIRRDVDQWYVCLTVEVEVKIKLKVEVESSIGIDVGLSSFLTDSNGNKLDNPNHLENSESKLKERQAILSRKLKGSKNKEKQRLLLSRMYRKIRNQRRNFHHTLSRRLIDNHELVCFEDLDINKMFNGNYNRSIADAGWGQFISILRYKAEEAGTYAIAVDPSYTSVDCSRCGYPAYKDIHTRMHTCFYCGLVLDRDHNAAINILRLGTSLLNREVCLTDSSRVGA